MSLATNEQMPLSVDQPYAAIDEFVRRLSQFVVWFQKTQSPDNDAQSIGGRCTSTDGTWGIEMQDVQLSANQAWQKGKVILAATPQGSSPVTIEMYKIHGEICIDLPDMKIRFTSQNEKEGYEPLVGLLRQKLNDLAQEAALQEQRQREKTAKKVEATRTALSAKLKMFTDRSVVTQPATTEQRD